MVHIGSSEDSSADSLHQLPSLRRAVVAEIQTQLCRRSPGDVDMASAFDHVDCDPNLLQNGPAITSHRTDNATAEAVSLLLLLVVVQDRFVRGWKLSFGAGYNPAALHRPPVSSLQTELID